MVSGVIMEYKIIDDAELFIGKTIRNIYFNHSRLSIRFTDDTVCIINPRTDFENYPYLDFNDEVFDDDLCDLGFITEEELLIREDLEFAEQQKETEENEQKLLKKLKEKYES